jgi:murein DD-endopeptidase MepM/ murein hydrolase activator NlpD
MAPDSPAQAWKVSSSPAAIVNGAPIVFRVKAPAGMQSLSGKWLEHEVYFSYDRKGKFWLGVAGASLETKPASYPLLLEGKTKSGKTTSYRKQVRVRATKYPSIAVTVSKKFTEPDPQQLKQIAEDKTVKQDTFRTVSEEREWNGRFAPPVDARISDVFGTQRTFNGKVQSSHQGLDYAVPQGTPIAALNSGTVLLARPLYFEGNCIVIDHGQGLLSLYLHLSDFKVHEGERVERGQQLGLSGSSGRATGPHLHIAVRWQGVYLNPETLMKLDLP